MQIDHKKVNTLRSFFGVKLKGNETFDELLQIEKDSIRILANRWRQLSSGHTTMTPIILPGRYDVFLTEYLWRKGML